jgi:hypothetical protein
MNRLGRPAGFVQIGASAWYDASKGTSEHG